MAADGERLTIAAVVIAWNEAQALRRVLPAVPRDLLDELIVVDGGSSDGTAAVARELGAEVVSQRGRGYGAACLSGALAARSDILVFFDGDYSDDPADLSRVLAPVLTGDADLVVAARNGPGTEPGALAFHQRLGNRLVCLLLRLLLGIPLQDIGSFRAIRRQELLDLGLEELSYGWPVEMVVKAARSGLRITGVPVNYRRRIGVSKVSGTMRGSLRAGGRMIAVVVRHAGPR